MQNISLPDITQAQAAAALTWIVGEAVTMKFVDAERSKVILSVGLTVVAAAWKIADAVIRNGRAKIAAAAIANGAQVPGSGKTRV